MRRPYFCLVRCMECERMRERKIAALSGLRVAIFPVACNFRVFFRVRLKQLTKKRCCSKSRRHHNLLSCFSKKKFEIRKMNSEIPYIDPSLMFQLTWKTKFSQICCCIKFKERSLKKRKKKEKCRYTLTESYPGRVAKLRS